jgi:hypothetical protein
MKPLKIGTKVKFDIAQGLDIGKAVIIGKDKDTDDGHYNYQLDVYEGSLSNIHRNKKGELWVNDFEVEEIFSEKK